MENQNQQMGSDPNMQSVMNAVNMTRDSLAHSLAETQEAVRETLTMMQRMTGRSSREAKQAHAEANRTVSDTDHPVSNEAHEQESMSQALDDARNGFEQAMEAVRQSILENSAEMNRKAQEKTGDVEDMERATREAVEGLSQAMANIGNAMGLS